MAHPEGFEPPTLGSEVRCSVQLSYGCTRRLYQELPSRSTDPATPRRIRRNRELDSAYLQIVSLQNIRKRVLARGLDLQCKLPHCLLPHRVSRMQSVREKLLKKGFARLGLILFSLVLALIVAEGLVRLLDLGPTVFYVPRGMVRLSPDPELRYELTPRARNPSSTLIINSHGLRDNCERSTVRQANQLRIACIGDSVAFGFGADNAHTFAVWLERLLAPRVAEKKVEALNFGVPGYNILQVARQLETKVCAFQPDVVLYLYSLNDVQTFSEELEALLNRPELSSADRRYVWRLWEQAARFGRVSRLWLWLQHAWDRNRLSETTTRREPAANDMIEAMAGRAVAFYTSLYQDAAAQARLREGFRRLRTWSERTRTPVCIVVVPIFVDLHDYPLTDLHQQIRDTAQNEKLFAFDLLEPLRRESIELGHVVNADPLHPNAEGYRVAAEAVSGWLLELLPSLTKR